MPDHTSPGVPGRPLSDFPAGAVIAFRDGEQAMLLDHDTAHDQREFVTAQGRNWQDSRTLVWLVLDPVAAGQFLLARLAKRAGP